MMVLGPRCGATFCSSCCLMSSFSTIASTTPVAVGQLGEVVLEVAPA